MLTRMVIVATLVVSLAAALHVGIFLMESVAWTRPAIWKRFGLQSQADAETTKTLAYNQGVYNLFLALGAIVGVVFFGAGCERGALVVVVSSMASLTPVPIV